MSAGLLMAAISLASAADVIHPAFTTRNILPAGMQGVAGLGGMGLLPNGDGVICTWGGARQTQGEVWIVPGLANGNPGAATRIATGLREALGVAVVGNDFYVSEKSRILKFTGSDTHWTATTFFTLGADWQSNENWHHYAFNLSYHENALWFTTSTAYPYDANEPKQRGALMRLPLDGSGYQQWARGFYAPNGMGIGPEGEIFVTDNEGYWKPANALYWVPVKGNLPVNGRFFGHRTQSNHACGTMRPAVDGSSCPEDPEFPPAIWLPYGSFSKCPTRPILLKQGPQSGPYAGQMISGDISRGGIIRYQLEKVNQEWQGAVFHFQNPGSGGNGIGFGIHQFHLTPAGDLLAAGIGGGAQGLGGEVNWNWNGAVRGLHLMSPTAHSVFDMLAIRSVKDGFEVEFTEPASAAAGLAANWSVKTTVYTPTEVYGGDSLSRDNEVPVGITSATLSPDGRRVRLKLASLLTRRMYAIQVDGVKSADGDKELYTSVGYYTLNHISPDSVVTSLRMGKDAGATLKLARRIQVSAQRGGMIFDGLFQASRPVDARGRSAGVPEKP